MLPLRSKTQFPRTAKSSPLRESRKSRQALTERGVQEKFSAVVTSVTSAESRPRSSNTRWAISAQLMVGPELVRL